MNRYPIYNKFAYLFLYSLDLLLQFFVRPFLKKKTLSRLPRSILICNNAHLGDVILTTSLLPVLKKLDPKIHIGMLVGSWCHPIVASHPCIDSVHYLDHWKVNRTPLSLIQKILHYCSSYSKAKRAVKKKHYECALDCNFHFPNSSFFLWRAKIPFRIGFHSAGFGPLLTQSYPWNPKENRSAVEAYFSLLQSIPSCQKMHSSLHPNLYGHEEKRERYVVLHPGTGEERKEWPFSFWLALIKLLAQEGESLILTGKGKKEKELAERLFEQSPSFTNLCDRLEWDELVSTIQKATLFVGVDSAAGHVAAAVKTPSVLLFTGIHPPLIWKPYFNKSVSLTHATSCAPCFRGCSAMNCIRQLSVEQVYQQIRKSKDFSNSR